MKAGNINSVTYPCAVVFFGQIMWCNHVPIGIIIFCYIHAFKTLYYQYRRSRVDVKKTCESLLMKTFLSFIFLITIIQTFPLPATGQTTDFTVYSIKSPESFTIDTFPEQSYSYFLQHLAADTSPVIHDYKKGVVANSFYNVLAVIKLPLMFSDDLEQCADFAMRLRAEYFKASGNLDSLYLFDYSGKRTYYSQSGKSYRAFLRTAFANSNSYSLKKGCRSITKEELRPGDMIIQNADGGVGHVSVIVNSCTSKSGERMFLIGYSFMPAQQFHIEHSGHYGKDGWFTINSYCRYLKDNLDYGEPQLRRF